MQSWLSPTLANLLFVQAWDDSGYDSHNSYQDYGVGGGGFHGHKKRLVASDPSPHVIFLGLDIGFTESDVRGTLFTIVFSSVDLPDHSSILS
jgi:hypothetical protein